MNLVANTLCRVLACTKQPATVIVRRLAETSDQQYPDQRYPDQRYPDQRCPDPSTCPPITHTERTPQEPELPRPAMGRRLPWRAIYTPLTLRPYSLI